MTQTLLERFCYQAGWKSDHTERAYVHAIKSMLGKQTEVTYDLFRAHLLLLPHRNYSASTLSVHSAALRTFLDWLVIEEEIELTASQLKWLERELKRIGAGKDQNLAKTPCEHDIQAMLAAVDEVAKAKTEPELGWRDLALVYLLYNTGMRIDEAARLRVGQVNLELGEATVKGKGRKERKVYFSPKCGLALKQYWQARQNSSDAAPAFSRFAKNKRKPAGLSTNSLRSIIEQVRIMADVKHFTPHSFRHYFATRLLRETNDATLVQLALGHADLNTTMLYAKADPELLRRAHKELFG